MAKPGNKQSIVEKTTNHDEQISLLYHYFYPKYNSKLMKTRLFLFVVVACSFAITAYSQHSLYDRS
ncbi:MAG: hypothetical protein ABFD10_13810, partial [Prolixibacteraceae bacterium]